MRELDLHWACTFHVVCVISFALGNQREHGFGWNMGLRDILGMQAWYNFPMVLHVLQIPNKVLFRDVTFPTFYLGIPDIYDSGSKKNFLYVLITYVISNEGAP